MQSDCKNRGVFEDSHFATLLAFAHDPLKRRLQQTIQNRSWRSPKSLPTDASKLIAALKCFRDGFGTLLGSKWPAQTRPPSLPEAFLETSTFHFGLVGSLQNRFWTPLGPLRAGFWTIFGHHVHSKINSQAILSLELCSSFLLPPFSKAEHGGGSCEALEFQTCFNICG